MTWRLAQNLIDAMHAAKRLAMIVSAVQLQRVYHDDSESPEVDEDILCSLIEEARNVWHPVWRRRSKWRLERIDRPERLEAEE